MAEKNAQSEAFLKQMERQRLLKLCNRSIDLRGKVPGECQAYQFGGRTHYLDDRGYLLAKQLLERFKGRYTVGVYEALLKGIKTLAEKPLPQANIVEEKPILLRDKSSVQLIPFDMEVQRSETRINFATPIAIKIEDVLYHGSTVDITTSAIRVALRRAFTIEKGDKLSVNFVEFAEKSENPTLSSVPYKVMSVTHDELRTQLVLTRNRHDDAELSAWLDKWCLKHLRPEYLDLNIALFNLACQFYARFYTETMSKPLLWLNHDGEVTKLHLATIAEHHVQAFVHKGHLNLAKLPLAKLNQHASDHLLASNGTAHVIARRNDTDGINQVLSWHAQHENSHLMLLSSQNIEPDFNHLEENFNALNRYKNDYGDELRTQLKQLHNIVAITDISECCQHLPTPNGEQANQLEEADIAFPEQIPDPFNTFIQRKEQRYFIRTGIKLYIDTQAFEVKSTNGSENGLAVALSGKVDIYTDKRVKIDFVRWQQLTSKVQLTDIPFVVRDVRYWQGETHIHLEREKRACSSNINTFFADVIKLNKESLTEDNEHLRVAAESDLYSRLLTPQLHATPIFMTMDEASVRILQAVTTTPNNQAAEKTAIWLALQNHVREISEQLKTVADKADEALHFGIYAYLDNKGRWLVETDFSFEMSTEKNMFLNRAVLAEQYFFYHCSLVPVKPIITTDQQDLYDKLINLRSQSQHKVKQIRGVIHSIFAIGELTDISDIIASYYN
jgi:hypothetical protein